MKKSFGEVVNGRFVTLAALAMLTALLAALGLFAARFTTNSLLQMEAASDARDWTNHLSIGSAGLTGLAQGAAPTAESRRYLDDALGIAGVYAFRIYDIKGVMKVRSDGRQLPVGVPLTLATADSEHAPVLRGSKPQTIIHRGNASGEPAYFASSVLPIFGNGKQVGWIVTHIDQTERQATVFGAAATVALLICAVLMATAAGGLWYRGRQQRAAEKRLNELTRRDPLTGLNNRQTFADELARVLAAQGEQSQRAALIELEIAETVATSQNYGTSVAEHQIVTTAQRLVAAAPAAARLGRLDTARFGVLIDNITDPMAILSLTKELATSLSQPTPNGDSSITTTVHAGIALSQSDGADAESLMLSAGLALRSAQEQGSPGYGFFNPEIAQDARRRMAVQRAVAEATANNTFRLDFQPVYHISSGELSGFEALIRLHDPELGSISPVEFIPIAEQSGHINKIGAWCLQEACRVAAEWPAHLLVAVNLSPAQFYSGTLISDVQTALLSNRFPSYRLEVEITEGTLLKDSELVTQQLSSLRETGVAIALDDFGTGYSSLSYLWKFPFSKIKIDRSFVNALDESQSARGILRSIIKLGHGLGLVVTAEGIENNKQFSTLRDLGCDLAQGYLLDRPSRVEDLAAIILRNFAKGLNRRPARQQAHSADVIPLRGQSGS